MTRLVRQSLTAYATPLCETVTALPQPRGSEVLLRVRRCGVCHSDLHMQDGYFKLGEEKTLDVRAGRTLPFTLGHEIAGTVEAAGTDAQGIAIGSEVAVYPWIGCGECVYCAACEENLCVAPRHLGIYADGGFATHIIVPHPRYLLAYAPLAPGFAAALMCSGLTAYAALKRVAERAQRGPLLLVGLGGVGMMGLSIARAMFAQPPFVADIDAAKREAALAAGAQVAFDPSDPGARKALMAATGGVHAVIDFVGSDKSLLFATGALARGGRVVVTGLLGGTYTTAIAMFSLRAMAIEGILTGTLAEAKELLALARDKQITAPRLEERPLRAAQSALDDLRAGRVLGRVVLTNDE